jgi:hypothetical protein
MEGVRTDYRQAGGVAEEEIPGEALRLCVNGLRTAVMVAKVGFRTGVGEGGREQASRG